jgi:hypothetical protein
MRIISRQQNGRTVPSGKIDDFDQRREDVVFERSDCQCHIFTRLLKARNQLSNTLLDQQLISRHNGWLRAATLASALAAHSNATQFITLKLLILAWYLSTRTQRLGISIKASQS